MSIHSTRSDDDGTIGLPTGRRATIEDVALRAHVSVATVSRALRGLPNVATATRRRVELAATALKYRPDPAASRLAARKTKTITVGVPSLSGWYFSTVVAGAEAVCNEAGYEFQVIAVGSLVDRDRLLDDEHALERRTDGLILVDVEPSAAQAEALVARGVAVATVGHVLVDHPAVSIDDALVGRLAAEHLVSLGHRRIAIIDGLDDDPMNFVVPTTRRTGFEQALADAGLSLSPSLAASGNFTVDGGRDAMRRLMETTDPPTAVFAMSDEMAFGVLMELDERGLVAGSDVSVVGVDDHEFACVVKLTTVRQPVADHGANAARLLIEAMGSDEPLRTTIRPDVELVVRSTTGPA